MQRATIHPGSRLALCIPADANPAYLGAILNSLADGNPPQHLSEEEKKSWRPPSRDILEPVAARAWSGGISSTQKLSAAC